MRSHQSIQIPLRLDRSRKALMTQLSANIIKNANATPKRSSAQQYDQWRDLQTLKKKQHIDMNAMDKKQNQKLIKQNDRKFYTQKQIPIKHNNILDNQSKDSTQKKTTKIISNQEQFDLKHKPLKQTGFKQMSNNNNFDLGAFTLDNSKLFSEKERILISIQEKLDSHILFLKENRKKKKGELFSIIKKTFLENYRIFLEFSHIKKILYISENYYTIQKFGDGLSFECLVDINLKCKQSQQKELQNELRERKESFRSKLYLYKQTMSLNSNTKQCEIPQVKFQFQQVLENRKNVLKTNMNKLFDGQLVKKKKVDRFFMLNDKNSKVYEQSKKNLQKGMKRVQSILKKEKQLDLGRIMNKIFEKRQLSEKEIRRIIHEIGIIYRDRGVINMLESHLIESLSKKLILSEGILSQVVDTFLSLSPKVNRENPFLTIINHKMGILIRIDSGSAKEFEKSVVMNTLWMKLFEYQIQMNGDYLRGKMQEQREKLFQEIDKENEENNRKQEQLKLKQKTTYQEQLKNQQQQNLKFSPNKIQKVTLHKVDQQESKAFGFQQQEDEHFIKINEVNRSQGFCMQKDDFKSTLSNSEQLFYEDDDAVIDEAQCCE